jgi:ABC-type multidrug transport system ATPase subunit
VYWIVRAKWNEKYDQTERFVSGRIWENGYSDKFIDVVKKVKKNEILLLAKASYIEYYAICKENKQDGKTLKVQKWIKILKPIYIPATGNYVKTISRLNNKTFIQRIDEYIKTGNLIENFSISSLKTTNFMSLQNKKIKFSKGINIFIGENGSGKSQIIKLLYGVLDANNQIALDKEDADYEKQRAIASSLTDIFKTSMLGNLVTKSKKDAQVDIELTAYDISFKFGAQTKKEITKTSTPFVKTFVEKKSIFIPAKEVLSFFKGFRVMYEKKYLEFDKCYYNLCKALEEPLSKSTSSNKNTIKSLEKILNGKIKIIDGVFCLETKDGKTYEINLVAEGLRKIGLLSYLLNNESLDENSILFWDEPESNMNPKLIQDIVKYLVTLSNNGMQIFITTHSPYIIESFNNHLKKDKIKNIKTDDEYINDIEPLNPKNITAYLLENNKITSILNNKLGLLDDKFLQEFNNINALYDKMRDIEWKNK